MIKNDGTLWSWGYQYYGSLGHNQQISKVSSPVQVPGTTWAKSSIGYETAFAIKTDGTLWSWGRNDGGHLGQNDTVYRSSPVQVPGTTWSSIGASQGGIFAIKTNGTLWAWGNNNYGGLGLNQGHNVKISSPIQIPGTTWKEVTGGMGSGLATKTDGTLWTWGWNIYGKLGQNSYGNPTQRSSPVQIPGTTWDKPRANGHYPRAIKTDGTLWVWGTGSQGNLGLNDEGINRSSPTQVPGTTWSDADVGYDGSCIATKTDGTLWSWGYNQWGQIDHNDRTSRSSPIQIGSETGWSQPIATNHGSFALKEA
jgi:alpha-tubulin suppressor-like RCC1 family protein